MMSVSVSVSTTASTQDEASLYNIES
jgi:hypothetical protein